jgi:hypothetical protein
MEYGSGIVKTRKTKEFLMRKKVFIILKDI